MSNTELLLSQLLHWLAAALLAGTLLWAYRWMRRQSVPLATVFGVGLICRALFGLALFAISYLDLPVASGLHFGDGFWELASDARTYYRSALHAHEAGLSVIASSAGSPAYVKTLALWMHVVGTSPAVGLFLNLVIFTALSMLLVQVWGPRGTVSGDLPCVVAIAGFAFSPAIAIHGSQSMKEDLFLFLIAVTGVAVLRLYERRAWRGWPVDLAACLLVAGAVFMVAGIRSYFGLMLWGALVAGFVAAVAHAGLRGSLRIVVMGALSLSLAWGGYRVASGTYYWNPIDVPAVVTPPAPAAAPAPQAPAPSPSSPSKPTRPGDQARVPSAVPETPAPAVPQAPEAAPEPSAVAVMTGTLVNASDAAALRLRNARVGFERSGGATNVVIDRKGSGLLAEGRVLLFGLVTMLVPITLLKAVGAIDFEGGRSLLLLTDLDTLFLDLTLVATFVFLARNWRAARTQIPYLVFMGGLGLVTMLLLAYAVTNYGTLFRLRAMAGGPLWLLVLALRRPSGAADRPHETTDVA